METAEMPELLTVAEVCAMTRQSKTTIHREIDAGEFEVLRLGPRGGSIRVTRRSVVAYMERRTIATEPSAPVSSAA